MTPIVSVIIPSYNHEKYIKECIDSVLNQTFQDFEIIITDDGSIDHTVDIIRSYSDPRIKLFLHTKNKGACVAANNCIENSQGKYIAMLSSDDAWYPEKLELQVKYLEEHPNIAVVFSKVDWIDENGNLFGSDFPYLEVFNVPNRSRFEWLGYFFTSGNCLCHPSSLIRKGLYYQVGLLNPAFANIPDFDLWIRICLKYNIYILDQRLIRFRRRAEEANASGDNLKNRIRTRFEYKQILNHYLRIKDPQELALIFPESYKFGNALPEIIPFFLGRIAIDSGVDFSMLWGLESIYNLLENEISAQLLEKQCNFTYMDFIKLSGTNDVFRMALVPIPIQKTLISGTKLLNVKLLSKYKKLFFSIIYKLFSHIKTFLMNVFHSLFVK